MSVWDISTPMGSEDKSLGAPRLREKKLAIQDALSAGGIFPGSDPTNPKYYTIIQADTTANRPAASSDYIGRWFYNRDTLTIQRDNGTTWDDLTDNYGIVTGVKMIWFEATAPTNWTQVTTNNDMILRSALAGAASAVRDSISSPPTHDHGTATGSANATHFHVMAESDQYLRNSLVDSITIQNFGGITNTTAIPHTHNISAVAGFTPKYIDAIICTKD